jgi:hypothetical protein
MVGITNPYEASGLDNPVDLHERPVRGTQVIEDRVHKHSVKRAVRKGQIVDIPARKLDIGHALCARPCSPYIALPGRNINPNDHAGRDDAG